MDLKTKYDRIGPDKYENATNVKRVPKSEELFNVGFQPHIPTRGFSTIIKPMDNDSDPYNTPLKIGVDELKSNKFKKRKEDKWKIHHKYF